MLLPDVIRDFRSEYPGIRIQLREGGNNDFARWLTSKSIDCCFAIEPKSDIKFDWIPIREEELMMWLPQDHPYAGRDSYPVEKLEIEQFIAIKPGSDTELDRMLEKEKLAPQVAFSTADAYTAYRMVEAGLGVSFNNKLFTDSWSGNVVSLPFDPPQKITLGIAVPSLKECSPAARRFIDTVQKSLILPE